MKNRIIFWENECLSEELMRSIVDLDLFQLVGKIQLEMDAEETDKLFRLDNIANRKNEWDYFLFAYPNSEMLVHLNNILTVLGVDRNICFNLFDIAFMNQKQSIILAKILKAGNRITERVIYTNLRKMNNYVTVTAEDLSFVANSSDTEIPQKMFETKKVWVSDDMHRLGKLLDKYYSIRSDSDGYFFDIGANIGTTSVYMGKVVLPNFKIHAFEPMKENYKMLRANLILNEIDNYEISNVALSSVSTKYNMKKVEENWGMCAITDEEGGNVEQVSSITLDDYVSNKDIDINSNIVLWVDTEGFEIDVLLGAIKLLKSKPALFFEFNLECYGNRIDELVSLLKDNYSGFINFDDDDKVIKDITCLKENNKQVDIFMIP